MALSEGARRELERIAAGDDPGFGARGFIEAQRRSGSPDGGDVALLDRAVRKLDEKAGS